MDEVSDSDNVAKALSHDYELFENHWRTSFHKQYTHARNIVVTAFDISMQQAAARMAETSNFLAAKDEHLAQRFSADIPVGRELHQKLWRDLTHHARSQYAVSTPPAQPAVAFAPPPDVEVIVIDSDADEPGGVVRHRTTRGRAVAATHSTTRVGSVCQATHLSDIEGI